MVRRRVSRPRWVGGRTKRLPQGQGPRRQTNPTLGSGGGSFKMTRRYKTFGKSKEGKHDLAGQGPKNFRPAGAAWRGGPGPRPRPRPTDRLGRDPGTGDLGRDLTGINVLTRRSPGGGAGGPAAGRSERARDILLAWLAAERGAITQYHYAATAHHRRQFSARPHSWVQSALQRQVLCRSWWSACL